MINIYQYMMYKIFVQKYANDSVLVDLYSPMEKDGSYVYKYTINEEKEEYKTYFFRYNIAYTR